MLKSESFIQRIIFDKTTNTEAQVKLWIQENIGDLADVTIFDKGGEFVVELASVDNFIVLNEIDIDINANIKAFIGEQRKCVKSKIIAKNEAERIIVAIAMEPMVKDTDNEVFNEITIRNAAHKFLEHYRAFNVEHIKSEPGIALIESYITPMDTILNGEKIKKGTWIISMKIHDDETWIGVLNGDFDGVSIEGLGQLADEVFENAA